jgi:hypothetical protein
VLGVLGVLGFSRCRLPTLVRDLSNRGAHLLSALLEGS